MNIYATICVKWYHVYSEITIWITFTDSALFLVVLFTPGLVLLRWVDCGAEHQYIVLNQSMFYMFLIMYPWRSTQNTRFRTLHLTTCIDILLISIITVFYVLLLYHLNKPWWVSYILFYIINYMLGSQHWRRRHLESVDFETTALHGTFHTICFQLLQIIARPYFKLKPPSILGSFSTFSVSTTHHIHCLKFMLV